jgi:anti-anti-sigma factor
MAPTGSGSWYIVLDRDVAAPRIARAAVEEWISDLPLQVRENAVIAVGELVANAVQFGEPPIEVRAGVGSDALVVEVSDEGTRRPHRRVPSEDGGVGLNVVYLLADRVEIEAGRSCVRCTFSTTHLSGSTVMRSEGDLFDVELRRQGTALRIVLRGDIDLAARPALYALLDEVDPSGLDRVVIDMREVTFFDTTGLHLAQRFDRWGRDHGVAVVFTRAIPAVMLALQAAGLAYRLTFSDAPEDQPEPPA